MLKYEEYKGFYFEVGTVEKVKQVIAESYDLHNRVRVWYGNPETGKTWPEEYDVLGYIGRSTGDIKIPLLINNCNSLGGTGILTENILRIDDTKTHKCLYRHPDYNNGNWEIKDLHKGDKNYAVYWDNTLTARFDTELKAAKYIDYMNGKRYTK